MSLSLENPIQIIESGKPGKTVAIFAGIHGNEQVGVRALQMITKDLKIKSGKVYLVLANPEAIKQNIREINKNLNRLFLVNNSGNTFEDALAKDLMKILDKSDALLDIHASNSKITKPFVIFNKYASDIAKKLNFEIISTGWNKFHHGSTDEYMETIGKPGLCTECGSVFETEKDIPLAIQSIYQFLKYFDLIDSEVKYNDKPQKYLSILNMAIKETSDFRFTKTFNDFDILDEGEVFATDGEKRYVAGSNECIIFPRENKPIGGEVFVLCKIQETI